MLRGLTIIGGAAAAAVLAIVLFAIIQVYWFEGGDAADPAGQAAAIAAATAASGFGTMVVTTDLGVANARAGFGAGLGVVATPEQVARVNISIPPDGRNLPPGQGTVAEGVVSTSLAAVRESMVVRGLTCVYRAAGDDPCIIETWT